MELWFGFIITGLFAGFVSGLLGIGGGVVIVPALSFIFSHQSIPSGSVMHAAIASSLAIIVFTTSVSAISHHQHEPIRWSLYRRFLPGLVLGACSGVLITHLLHSNVLRITFAIFLVLVAISLLLEHKTQQDVVLPGRMLSIAVAYGVGVIASLLGIGGSIFMTPYLLHHKVSLRQTVGVAVMTSFTIALIGASVSIFTGSKVAGLPAWSSGYIIWPAVIGVVIPSVLTVPLGAWVSHRTNTELLKRLFAFLLILISIHLVLLVWH